MVSKTLLQSNEKSKSTAFCHYFLIFTKFRIFTCPIVRPPCTVLLSLLYRSLIRRDCMRHGGTDRSAQNYFIKVSRSSPRPKKLANKKSRMIAQGCVYLASTFHLQCITVRLTVNISDHHSINHGGRFKSQ